MAIQIKSFEPTNLTFTEPKKTANGGKIVNLGYQQDKSIQIILPHLKNTFIPKLSMHNKWTLSLSLTPELIEQLTLVDDFIKAKCQDPDVCCAWLGSSKSKPFSAEIIEQKYHPLVTYSRDKETKEIKTNFAPTIRINLPTEKTDVNQFRCEFYDQMSEPMMVDGSNLPTIIGRGQDVSCLVSGYLWSSAVGFGLSLTAKQIKVHPKCKGVCHLMDPEEPVDE